MNSKNSLPSCRCSCCAHIAESGFDVRNLNRRNFLVSFGGLAAGGVAFSALKSRAADAPAPYLAPTRPPRFKKTLRVQPVLMLGARTSLPATY